MCAQQTKTILLNKKKIIIQYIPTYHTYTNILYNESQIGIIHIDIMWLGLSIPDHNLKAGISVLISHNTGLPEMFQYCAQCVLYYFDRSLVTLIFRDNNFCFAVVVKFKIVLLKMPYQMKRVFYVRNTIM